jgi:hypothetical protein
MSGPVYTYLGRLEGGTRAALFGLVEDILENNETMAFTV